MCNGRAIPPTPVSCAFAATAMHHACAAAYAAAHACTIMQAAGVHMLEAHGMCSHCLMNAGVSVRACVGGVPACSNSEGCTCPAHVPGLVGIRACGTWWACGLPAAPWATMGDGCLPPAPCASCDSVSPWCGLCGANANGRPLSWVISMTNARPAGHAARRRANHWKVAT